MKKTLIIAFMAVFAVSLAASVSAGIFVPESKQELLPIPLVVEPESDYVVFTPEVSIEAEEAMVIIAADGSWGSSEQSTGEIEIYVDGEFFSRQYMVFNPPNSTLHPFSLRGAIKLTQGSHDVEMIVRAAGGEVVLLSGALTVLVVKDAYVENVSLEEQVIDCNVVSPGVSGDYSVNNCRPLSAKLNMAEPATLVLLFSGNFERLGSTQGDVMVQFRHLVNKKIHANPELSLGINDLVIGHDEATPIGIFSSLELVPGENQVELAIGRLFVPTIYEPDLASLMTEGNIVVLAGDIPVLNRYYPDVKIGDEPITLRTMFYVPESGLAWVMFMGRWLDLDNSGTGGEAKISLLVDDEEVGPSVQQGWIEGFTISQRSFVTTALVKAKPGMHTAEMEITTPNADMPALTMVGQLSVIY